MEIQILGGGGGGEVGRMAVLVKGGSSHAFLMDYGVNFDDEGAPPRLPAPREAEGLDGGDA